MLTGSFGQAGRRIQPSTTGAGGGASLNIVATRDDGTNAPITLDQISLFDGGIQQTIKNLTPDPSPARIVLLVDNSLSIRADVEKLEQAAREFAYEIYEGDKLLIVGYDEQAEIVADWTDNAGKIETSLKGLRKRGQPHLFDALSAVMDQALRPLTNTVQKRIIVIISDGLDRESKTRFDSVLSELQTENITVYAVQAPDRTGGALRRDRPKPEQVIQQLVEGTGGLAFPISQPREAAKVICDELRHNRYVLSYAPTSIAYGEARRLLVSGADGISVRFKAIQPAR